MPGREIAILIANNAMWAAFVAEIKGRKRIADVFLLIAYVSLAFWAALFMGEL